MGGGGEVGGRWGEEGRWRGIRMNHGAFPWGELHFVTAQFLPATEGLFHARFPVVVNYEQTFRYVNVVGNCWKPSLEFDKQAVRMPMTCQVGIRWWEKYAEGSRGRVR